MRVFSKLIKKIVMNQKIFEPKITMTRKEIASIIGVSKNTLYRKIKESGIHIPPGLLNYKEQIMIIDIFTKGVNNHHENAYRYNGERHLTRKTNA